MANRRTLGGGRVLGSGKSIEPPRPAPSPAQKAAQTQAQAVRNTGLLSPSESSVSLSSQTSSTPISTDHEDLTSRIALDGDGVAQAAAAATSRMVCPICNEEMMTLLQLNRHIDDNHANLEEVEQDEAKTWFKQQMTKAKKFQPLALINQKLRGLEAFEYNNDVPPILSQAARIVTEGREPSPAPAPKAPVAEAPDPDEVVTRAHWQRPYGGEACSDPMCGKRLGPANGQINCRHCGKLFCEEHTMYQMKLSRAAKHEPVRGLWCRVCETCYKSRPGYNDHTGFERNHTDFFKAARRKNVDKHYLEQSRLETRLTRLTQLLADPPPPDQNQSTTNLLWSSIVGDKNHLRTLEQSVVPWEDDASIHECPFCQQPFSQYSLRRHHCRICGRVVCGDPTTACSSEIGLDVETKKPGVGKVAVDVRMCKDCHRTIFSKADFERELNAQPPDQRAFNNLIQFEHGIRLLLPKFQRLLGPLQDPENPPTPAQLAEASKVRKRLMDAFTQYDVAARRIRDLPTESPTQERLQKAIYLQATNFLHIHMLPLKSLPKIMRHATPNGMRGPPSQTNGENQKALSAINYNRIANGGGTRPSSSRASSESSVAVTALEAEEKPLPASMRKLRKLLGKSSQHQQSGPAISHPFDVSTSGGRPHLLISENFNNPQDPNVTPAERQHDRIAKLISLMKADNADMEDSFPDDLEMRIQFLEERGVDPLMDLVNFYSKRGRYANSCAVWGGWLVDLDDQDQDSEYSWSNTSSESFSWFSGVGAPDSPQVFPKTEVPKNAVYFQKGH